MRRRKKKMKGRNLHFVGIGGAGMSGLAVVCKGLGASVTGSDRAESEYTETLRAAGIDPAIGHSTELVPEQAEVVVSTAIGEDNPELAIARDRGQAVVKRGELLAEVCSMRRLLAVAGTHGKTTTAAMCVELLRACGADPTFLVGGSIPGAGPDGLPANAGLGKGEWLVAEADESDASFLSLEPEIAVVTNVELDHHDRWTSLAELQRAFGEFCGSAEILVCGDEADLDPEGVPVVRCGLERPPGERPAPVPPRVLAGKLRSAGGRLEMTVSGLPGADREWRVALGAPGRHNAFDATLALAATSATGEPLEEATASAALGSFRGVARRLERKGEVGGVLVYDDYAHHPTEVRAAIRAARELGAERLLVVFQPHLYSRTLALAHDFGSALAEADEVVVCDVYAAREEPTGELRGVDGMLVARAAADRSGGRGVWWTRTEDEAVAAVAGSLRPGDLLLTMGAGDVHRVGSRILAGEGTVAA